jgi:hypothetical protein
VLSSEDIQAEFEAQAVSFNERELSPHDDLVYTPAITLCALLSHVLFTGARRSCRAVIRVAVLFADCGRHVSGTNTGVYCRARGKIPHTMIRRLTKSVAHGREVATPN